jgi:hypothetical protein
MHMERIQHGTPPDTRGGDDAVYDFTQLKNGNLLFVGLKPYLEGPHKIWVFVTDSLGKKMFFNKEYVITSSTPEPMAVCATPDDGFSVVGAVAGGDAFIAHFVPKPVSSVTSIPINLEKYKKDFTVHLSETRFTLKSNVLLEGKFEISLFDISGKRIMTQSTNKTAAFDLSALSQGTYFVKIWAGARVETVKIFKD